MKIRNIIIGLVVEIHGERGYTDWLNGDMVVNFHTVYGGEGHEKIDKYNPKDIKLVMRIYAKNPKLFPKE